MDLKRQRKDVLNTVVLPTISKQNIYSCIGIHVVYWISLALLVFSSPFSVVFLIGCYSEGLFHVPLALGTRKRHTGSLVHEHVLRLISSKS
jgi:hypothetical protein